VFQSGNWTSNAQPLRRLAVVKRIFHLSVLSRVGKTKAMKLHGLSLRCGIDNFPLRLT
jgi:hypothetical protein